MAAWSTRTKQDPDQEPPQFADVVGAEDCTQKGCGRHSAVHCSYTDRRGRSCGTAWCQEHRELVEGMVYCRRHASTMTALGGRAIVPSSLPDVDFRGASLVQWVARDMNRDVRVLLESHATRGDTLIADQNVSGISDREKGRRWERGWRLLGNSGLKLKIAVYVREDDDATVYVQINGVCVLQGIPPWIARRRRGALASDQADAAERGLFYSFLNEKITLAATRQLVR
jgi:hypothetical protein